MIDNQYYTIPQPLPNNSFKFIEKSLRNTKKWAGFRAVKEARTPILQAYHIGEQLDCDLSFANGLSHCNTQLILYFIKVQPLCK